jgi:hypothetical protein
MSPDEQLLYESRVRNRQMILAGAAGVLLMVAAVIGLSGAHAKVNELTLGLIVDHHRGPLDIISAALGALAQLAIAATLVFLWRCAKTRLPQGQMAFIPILALVGAAISAVAGVLNAVVISIKVHEFVTTGLQTYDEANRLTSGSGLLILQVASQLASLLVAISFVLVSLQAMRVGLLPRFLGYLGMIAGALVLFPVIVLPVVQLYWLLAVGYLISGRWPSGLPVAWSSGRAEKWPSAAETRARRVAAAEDSRSRKQQRQRGSVAAGADPAPVDSGASAVSGTGTAGSAGDQGRTRASTPKRKRKRRR